MTIERTPTPSAGSLLSDALTNVSSLVRNEVDLARAELSENLERAGAAVGYIVAAVVIAMVALSVLAAALVAGVTAAGIPPAWAAVIVGVVLAVIAFSLSAKGLKDLKLSNIAPTRTAKNLRRDVNAIKEATHD